MSNELDTSHNSLRTLKNRVRELRTERGLSQGELAAAVDVSRQTINSIEQERYTPSLPLALAGLAVILAVIVAFLVELARGHNGDPYGWLGAIGGLTYIAAIIVFRIRG